MTKINLPSERQVGHLKLLRQKREISISEFNTLTTNEQLDIIRQLHGKDKYDLIISAQNADKLVPELHPQEIYLTVNEIGTSDVSELLALSSPAQISLLLDMDCWDGDNLSPVLSLHWFELILSTGNEKICQLIRELEPETLALFLKKHVTIIHGMEVFDSDEIDNAKRLEGLYDIDYSSEDAAKIIGALFIIWQDQEQESFLLIMEMIRSELITSFEEELYTERNNRLLDLGILPAVEARSMYSYVDPAKFSTGGKIGFELESDDINNPKALLAQAEPCNLLADILGSGIDHAAACELLLLVNRKMSADNVDFSETRQVGEAIQSTYDTLNLALEYLADKDADQAEQIFNNTYLLHLFQLGHSLVDQRIKKAINIANSAIYPYLDYQELLFIDSLLETPPCLYLPESEDSPAKLEQIRTMIDLNLVDLRLQQIKALEELFTTKLPFTLPQTDELDDDLPSLAQYFITAVANQVLGRELLPTPLLDSDLTTLREKTVSTGRLDIDFCQQLGQFVNQQADNLEFFTEFCLELWEDSLIETVTDNEESILSAFILDTQ
jgi:Family of unknown function (DUF6178)